MSAYTRFTENNADAIIGADASIFINFMHISLRYNYIYFSTPKVGCSSLIQTAQRLEVSDTSFMHDPPAEMHDRRLSPLLTPLQVSNFRRFLHREDVKKFCFVRNPFDRLLSCYLDKVRSHELTPRFLIKLGRTDGVIEFDEFIHVVAEESIGEMETHYAVQYLHTFQATIPYQFIGRFEHFDRDTEFLDEFLGIDFRKYVVRVDPHRTGPKNYQGYFTQAMIEFVRKRYRLDFEEFNYSMDLPS